MNEYLKLGHIEQVAIDDYEKIDNTYYLPHHAIIKKFSTFIRLRVVFDVSCKTNNSGLSLNDV